MQIVIEIDDKIYDLCNKNRISSISQLDVVRIEKAIQNGTPLPEGHGRIADMDEAIKCIEEVEGDDAIWAISLIEWACGKRTIIEADKGSEGV